MEKKLVRVPFSVDMAKKITEKSVEGRIVTRNGKIVRIICWDYKSMSGNYPLFALINGETQEISLTYSEDGKFDVFGHKVEDSLDLFLEIPEYMTFKEGDILSSGDDVFVLKRIDGDSRIEYYACSYMSFDLLDSDIFGGNLVYKLRYATEEEKQKLIDALKASKEPKAKEYLKRFFGIEQKQEYEFKPFDKVLVRDDKNEYWRADIFSHKDKNDEIFPWFCIGMRYKYCIPYNEKTKHLLGTTKNWEE